MKTKKQANKFKTGTVAIVGRPNAGKSTLLNALIQHKVAAVSPRPQTTRSAIHAFYEDDRGQIFFLDTPGLYRAKQGTKHHNAIIKEASSDADVIVYITDHTRAWGPEEEQLYDQLSHIDKPIIALINKTDIETPTHKDQYRQKLTQLTPDIIELSAQKGQHLKSVINTVLDHLPIGERNPAVDTFITPLLSHTSKDYLAEIIREKIYHHTTQEVPYQTTPEILSIEEDESKNRLKIIADIKVSSERYKPMIIGKQGIKIKHIMREVRNELQIATGKQVVVKLNVTT